MRLGRLELAREIIYADNNTEFIEPSYNVERTQEFWLGNVMAYYQWYRNVSFYVIKDEIGVDYFLSLYRPYHEMDIKCLVEVLDEERDNKRKLSALKRIRQYAKMSQSDVNSIN